MTVSNYYSKKFSKGIFKTCFICYYCPKVIIKKFLQLTCIVKALGDGSIFSSTSHFQERISFVCKHRRTEEPKTTVYIFVH